MDIETIDTLSYPTRYAAFDNPGVLVNWIGEVDGSGRELSIYYTDWHSVQLSTTEDRRHFLLDVSSGGFGNWSGRVWILDSEQESLLDEVQMAVQSGHWALYATYRGDFKDVLIEYGRVVKRTK
jgi:hypothetical protein